MFPDLLTLMRCPTCHTDLKLIDGDHSNAHNIVSGTVVCQENRSATLIKMLILVPFSLIPTSLCKNCLLERGSRQRTKPRHHLLGHNHE